MSAQRTKNLKNKHDRLYGIKTTDIYIQVNQKSLHKMQSPLDISINQLYLWDIDDKIHFITS